MADIVTSVQGGGQDRKIEQGTTSTTEAEI